MSDVQTIRGSRRDVLGAVASECGIQSPEAWAAKWLLDIFGERFSRAKWMTRIRGASPEFVLACLKEFGADKVTWVLTRRFEDERIPSNEALVVFVAKHDLENPPSGRPVSTLGVRLRRNWPGWVVINAGTIDESLLEVS